MTRPRVQRTSNVIEHTQKSCCLAYLARSVRCDQITELSVQNCAVLCTFFLAYLLQWPVVVLEKVMCEMGVAEVGVAKPAVLFTVLGIFYYLDGFGSYNCS